MPATDKRGECASVVAEKVLSSPSVVCADNTKFDGTFVYDLQILTSTQTTEETCIMKDSKLKVAPVTVGNPVAAASLAIDQSHLEEFASIEEESSVVASQRPPKGVFFTVRKEE